MNLKTRPLAAVPRMLAGALIALFGAILPGCSAEKAYSSPEAAADALVSALRSHDKPQVREILGPEGDEIISSGDEVADRAAAERFVAAWDSAHEFVEEDDGSFTVVVGQDDWPLPIPIVREGEAWRFDAAAGKDEILARRIGRNELDAIETCRALVDAQREYADSDAGGEGVGVYARRAISDPGTRNGLYWENKPGEPESPLGPFVAEALAEGYTRRADPNAEPNPYHGYRFRLLTAQGPDAPGGAMSYLDGDRLAHGFAAVAWPAEYGNSGIMTFIVSHRAIVYQKDLGTDTDRVARGLAAFDPDPSWTIP